MTNFFVGSILRFFAATSTPTKAGFFEPEDAAKNPVGEDEEKSGEIFGRNMIKPDELSLARE